MPAGQRNRLERVCRYALRPPVTDERLHLTDDGQGRLARLIALIEEEGLIERILRPLGVPTEVPAPRAARSPPPGLGPARDAACDDGRAMSDACS